MENLGKYIAQIIPLEEIEYRNHAIEFRGKVYNIICREEDLNLIDKEYLHLFKTVEAVRLETGEIIITKVYNERNI